LSKETDKWWGGNVALQMHRGKGGIRNQVFKSPLEKDLWGGGKNPLDGWGRENTLKRGFLFGGTEPFELLTPS